MQIRKMMLALVALSALPLSALCAFNQESLENWLFYSSMGEDFRGLSPVLRGVCPHSCGIRGAKSGEFEAGLGVFEFYNSVIGFCK